MSSYLPGLFPLAPAGSPCSQGSLLLGACLPLVGEKVRRKGGGMPVKSRTMPGHHSSHYLKTLDAREMCKTCKVPPALWRPAKTGRHAVTPARHADAPGQGDGHWTGRETPRGKGETPRDRHADREGTQRHRDATGHRRKRPRDRETDRGTRPLDRDAHRTGRHRDPHGIGRRPCWESSLSSLA